MNPNNGAFRVRREILARIAKLRLEHRLVEDIERLPYAMTAPGWQTIRCCVHKDRAILRLRTAARLGFDMGSKDDVERPLADYAAEALARGAPPSPSLYLLEEACNDCVSAPYRVTDACQGCLARPCSTNCPKKAVRFVDGQARIDSALCVGCGLCVQACPYRAVIRVPVPCEDACPVGAISRQEDGKRRIDRDKCVDCGRCVRECPFGAVMEPSRLLEAIAVTESENPAYALVAPATVAQFPGGPGRLSAALAALGFDAVVEVALGAELTANEEAGELAHRMESGGGPLATSCCPAWTRMARTALEPLAPMVSSTPSPMVLAASAVRTASPQAKTVFISPCLAKRREAEESGVVDLTLSSEELGAWFLAAGVELAGIAERPFDGFDGKPRRKPARGTARAFGASGGVAAAVAARFKALGREAPATLAVNGLDKARLKELARWASAPPEADLVEVMACEGGCVAGPYALANPKAAAFSLGKYAQEGGEEPGRTEA